MSDADKPECRMTRSGFSPEDRQRLMRWLRFGAEQATELKGEKATHVDVIWLLFQSAVLTMDRMPDQEKSWLTAGLRSGGWSMVGLSFQEMMDIERVRVESGMPSHDGNSARPLMRDDAQRSLDTMCFLRWCGMYVKSQKPELMRKAAVALARGGDTEIFRRIWVSDRKDISRAAVSKFRTVFAGHILEGLKRDCGIYHDGGVRFRDAPR